MDGHYAVGHLFSWLVAVFDKRSPADGHGDVLGGLAVLDETVLDVVVLAVFFLLSYMLNYMWVEQVMLKDSILIWFNTTVSRNRALSV